MSVPFRHIFRQGPMIATVARAGVGSVSHRLRRSKPGSASCPGPLVEATLPARNQRLIDDYIRHVGGDPGWYAGSVPPHLFCQWGLPLFARALKNSSYPVSRVINAGCRMEIARPLPSGEPLRVRARLETVDDDGRRAVLGERIVTGTESAPEALVCHMNALVLLKRSEGGGSKKPKPTVPEDAREIGRWSLLKRAGLDFALLTGDFNPIHWIAPFARMAGFKSKILHGFSTMARTVETLNRSLWQGRPDRLESIEVRFVGPVVLPAEVGVYVGDSGEVFVGQSPGAAACLTGQFAERQDDSHG